MSIDINTKPGTVVVRRFDGERMTVSREPQPISWEIKESDTETHWVTVTDNDGDTWSGWLSAFDPIATVALADAPVATEEEARTDIATSHGVMEIRPWTARTIASWYQSPGSVGHVLASLASGHRVIVDDLLDDIAATRREFPRDYADGSVSHWLALDMLATFAANYGKGE